MKEIELIENSRNDITDIGRVILENRGIKDVETYTHLTDDCLYNYSLLDNMQTAVIIFLKHIASSDKEHIHIVVDSDVDGYTSAAVMYGYIKALKDDYILGDIDITYSLHTKKQHGLSKDIEVPDDTTLLIIPDAGSNDVEQCKILSEKGVDIIILDHHIVEQNNPYACVVNNQACSYPNKELSGVGITYKFLQAVDVEISEKYAEDFIDLVALGNIADMMDIREYETRRLIDKGLKHIRNPLFRALVCKQEDSIHNKITIRNVQFYIVPLINAMVRMGTQQEKELLFKAFVCETEYFDYKPRGQSAAIKEDIYTRVARLCFNAKNRQKRLVDSAMYELSVKVDNYNSNDNILFVNFKDNKNVEIAGLVATKLANKYSKPCLCLHKSETEPNYFVGSGRNFHNSPILDLKTCLDDTCCFESLQGHANAFGLKIENGNIKKAIDLTNKLDLNYNNDILVDFLLDGQDLTMGLVKRVDNVSNLLGENIDEPLFAFNDITIDRDSFSLIGKNKNNIRVELDNGVVLLKFGINNTNDEMCTVFLDDFNDIQSISITAVGKLGINYFKGIATCQMIIEDYEITNASFTSLYT